MEAPSATRPHPIGTASLIRMAWSALFLSLSYAVIRYQIVGPIGWDQLPLFIANKAIAVCSVIFLVLKLRALRIEDDTASKFWGRLFGQAVSVHVILSLVVLDPSYFGKFFGESGLNFTGSATVLCGAIATVILWSRKGKISAGNNWTLFALLLVVAHLVFVGCTGWFNPQTWHGYLPPISLISALLAVWTCFLYKSLAERPADPFSSE